ncbi:hypothetical protein GBW32_01610 [Streptomyces tsukubensis]|nr:hypothetical protein GBW32_01610 [Streptomyces tsukubensis]
MPGHAEQHQLNGGATGRHRAVRHAEKYGRTRDRCQEMCGAARHCPPVQRAAAQDAQTSECANCRTGGWSQV